jgi:hypothetical protein
MSTAWHPQTDGAFERKNQTTEIGLRYIIFLNPDLPWSTGVIPFQSALNNAWTSAIQTSPNKYVGGFRPAANLSLLAGDAENELPDMYMYSTKEKPQVPAHHSAFSSLIRN